jgi:hypothetical protein
MRTRTQLLALTYLIAPLAACADKPVPDCTGQSALIPCRSGGVKIFGFCWNNVCENWSVNADAASASPAGARLPESLKPRNPTSESPLDC